MEEKENNKILFGLVGRNIGYSFSRGYFAEKFKLLGIEETHSYVNFDIDAIEEFPKIIHQYKFQLKGLNVTIPYKLSVFPYLDKIDKKARKIGAVNTIKITKRGRLKGYNTDVYGFKHSLHPLLHEHHTHALILGTGGASMAVAYALKKLDIMYTFVSRSPKGEHTISYKELTKKLIEEHTIIINCTPLGTFPNTTQCPDIPYEYLNTSHILYDLIYNPEETEFLKRGKSKGTTIKNGLEMLELQAEKAWEIWNK